MLTDCRKTCKLCRHLKVDAAPPSPSPPPPHAALTRTFTPILSLAPTLAPHLAPTLDPTLPPP